MLFSGPLVRKILSGQKTVTRRPVTPATSLALSFWSSHLGDPETGGMGGFDDLDWAAHEVATHASSVARGRADQPCTERCAGRDFCCTLVDGDADGSGEYLHVPGVGGETRQRVHSRLQPGDVLYVRETHAFLWGDAEPCDCDGKIDGHFCSTHDTIEYRADTGASAPGGWDSVDPPDRLCHWGPSIHMPKWASRIRLRVTEVGVERVQEITGEGAKAEGITVDRVNSTAMCLGSARDLAERRAKFQHLWDGIYGARKSLAWADDPWVWKVSFEVAEVKR